MIGNNQIIRIPSGPRFFVYELDRKYDFDFFYIDEKWQNKQQEKEKALKYFYEHI